jgi:hypothetical protein
MGGQTGGVVKRIDQVVVGGGLKLTSFDALLRLTCSDALLQDGVGNGNGQALAVQMSQFAYCMEQDCAQVSKCRASTDTSTCPHVHEKHMP